MAHGDNEYITGDVNTIIVIKLRIETVIIKNTGALGTLDFLEFATFSQDLSNSTGVYYSDTLLPSTLYFLLISRYSIPMEILLLVGAIYLVMVLGIATLVGRLERRLRIPGLELEVERA